MGCACLSVYVEVGGQPVGVGSLHMNPGVYLRSSDLAVEWKKEIKKKKRYDKMNEMGAVKKPK